MDDPKDEHEMWDLIKQQKFVEGGLKDPVTGEYRKCHEIAGVGAWINLVGMYMVNNMDDDGMDRWLKDDVGVARAELRVTIIGSLQKWCERHV